MGRNAYTTGERVKEAKSQTKCQKIQQVRKEVICPTRSPQRLPKGR